ncbi:hypothetical protein NPIL_553951 [Nephila pilipes]|uniref:Uncharacterized protein n=1 Tax=Nephila pilipes TaxID=299642 RepID=A0A8X6J8H2_NEPPI|nr:hypothetical protein NPIL_553951 [Nephila pilipes]
MHEIDFPENIQNPMFPNSEVEALIKHEVVSKHQGETMYIRSNSLRTIANESYMSWLDILQFRAPRLAGGLNFEKLPYDQFLRH